MLRNAALLLLVFLAAWIAGCAPKAAPDTRDADVKAVRDIETAWSKDLPSKNADQFVSHYADNAIVLEPNAPAVAGKEAIKESLKPMMADPNYAMSFEPTKVEASKGGDMVYVIGTYSMTMSDEKTKQPVTDKGKYLTVYMKQADGSWKAVADMSNTDHPLPAAR
ncbi:MAG: nuclear transport factor 2 family protein [Acidobacteria bacterium]|nr:nuclear transport factor 2 family protein [Acidobacteriota bacterium]